MEESATPGKSPSRALRLLRRRLPLLEWARRYDGTAAVADMVAGVTLGLTLVPQSIAYAALAGLPVHVGLYSAFVGTLLYVLLGTVKEVSIGPTSLMALLTLQSCRGLPIQFVTLLTFLSGCVVTAMGLLRLGFLVELISPAVTSGFTSGTAVIIVVAQLKGLLGLSFTAESIPENLLLIGENMSRVRLPDCLLSAVCCVVLLLLRALKDLPVNAKRRRVRKALWLVSIGRNALVVCAAAAFAYCVHDPATPLLKLSGRVEPGLPRFSLPAFSVSTGNSTLHFPDMLQELGSAVLLVPVVMVLANIAIAKAFTSGRSVDATQEMLALGVANIAGSLCHAMPCCGAFTRSAVSHSSGVRTPLAGAYSGIITLIALSFMTEYFYFIPKACLSSVLICAVIFMVDLQIFARLWRCSRPELLVLSGTFLTAVLWSVELSLLVGMLANVAALLYSMARPNLQVETVKIESESVTVVRPALALVYHNVSRVVRAASRAAAASAAHPSVLIDLQHVLLIDYSAMQALENLSNKLKAADQKLVLFNASSEALATLSPQPWAMPALRARTPSEALLVGAAGAAGAAGAQVVAGAETEAVPLLDVAVADHVDEKA